MHNNSSPNNYFMHARGAFPVMPAILKTIEIVNVSFDPVTIINVGLQMVHNFNFRITFLYQRIVWNYVLSIHVLI